MRRFLFLSSVYFTRTCRVLLACSMFCLPSLVLPSFAKDIEGKLIINGSSTMAPLVSEIGKRFESLHPDTRIDVQTGGSSRGMADVMNGLADIGMVSRALKPEERHLFEHVIAHDGITVILHRKNRSSPHR